MSKSLSHYLPVLSPSSSPRSNGTTLATPPWPGIVPPALLANSYLCLGLRPPLLHLQTFPRPSTLSPSAFLCAPTCNTELVLSSSITLWAMKYLRTGAHVYLCVLLTWHSGWHIWQTLICLLNDWVNKWHGCYIVQPRSNTHIEDGSGYLHPNRLWCQWSLELSSWRSSNDYHLHSYKFSISPK